MIKDFDNEFICGRKFQDVADVVIDVDKRPDISAIKDRSIIWCKTDFIKPLFYNLRKFHEDKSFVLITHNSDYKITTEIYQAKPKCIKHWYAQNVDHMAADLYPIPIGLENDIGPSKGIYTDYSAIKYTSENINAQKQLNKIYCNFNENTNPARITIKKVLIEKDMAVCKTRSEYKEYCNDISRHMFVASPRGNGIDCHRTWEALYMGSIPIVGAHYIYSCFKDLPIIKVSDWWMVDQDLLDTEYRTYISNKNKYNYSMLTMTYWNNIILEKRKQL